MECCGASISGGTLVLVPTTKLGDGFSAPQEYCQKIVIGKSQDDVRAFCQTLRVFVRDQKVRIITLKARASAGQFAGGSDSFKIEGLLQALEDVDVHILQPATIKARLKRISLSPPMDLRKYQIDAFETACAFLAK